MSGVVANAAPRVMPYRCPINVRSAVDPSKRGSTSSRRDLRSISAIPRTTMSFLHTTSPWNRSGSVARPPSGRRSPTHALGASGIRTPATCSTAAEARAATGMPFACAAAVPRPKWARHREPGCRTRSGMGTRVCGAARNRTAAAAATVPGLPSRVSFRWEAAVPPMSSSYSLPVWTTVGRPCRSASPFEAPSAAVLA